MLHGNGLLEFLRLLRILYLEFCGSGCVCYEKQYKWRGPVVSESWLFCCLYHFNFFCIKYYSKEAVKVGNAMIPENKTLQTNSWWL